MNLNLLALCATPLKQDKHDYQIEFHGGDFIEYLILCDNFVLDSLFLSEIPHLVSNFGIVPVLELVKSDFFQIRSETFLAFGSTGRLSKVSNSRARKGDLPYCSFCIDPFSIYPYEQSELVEPPNERSYIVDQKKFNSNNLKVLQTIQGLNKKEYRKLKKSIADSIVHFQSTKIIDEISKQNYKDFKIENTAIKYAISIELQNRFNINLKPEKITFNIKFIDDTDFSVSSNLKSLINMNDEQVHNILERSLLSICAINYNSALMREHNVRLGYRENEIDVLYYKILSQYINDTAIRKNFDDFRKIVEIKNLPDLNTAFNNKQIDLIKVLEIRNCRECTEFRTWINNQKNLDLKDLRESLESVSQIIRDKLNTKTGKITKFAISQGSSLSLGLIDPVLGISSSIGVTVLDNYLSKNFLSKKPHFTFLNNKFPSIYKSYHK